MPLGPTDYARFAALVQQASGLEVPDTRRAALEQGIGQALADTRTGDLDTLYQSLASDGGRPVLDRLVEALTIGETYFFRNRPQFEALTQHILPELVARRRPERRLRLWSAGCATGEEAYSLAMVLEGLLPDIDQWDILILATDINRQSLAKAERGVYGPWSFREVAPALQQKFFLPQGRNFEVLPRIRARVSLAYLNLMGGGYPSLLTNTHNFDLILCRNVLIYFGEAATQHIAAHLHAALAPDGWLVVGHADNLAGATAAFAVHYFPGTVMFKKQSIQPVAALPPPALPVLAARPAPPRVALRPVPAPATAARPLAPPAMTVAQALAWAAQGQVDQALAALATLAAANRSDAEPCYQAARLEANRLKLSAAEAHIDQALERAPLWAAAHYLRGLILQTAGRLEPATEAFRHCVYAEPAHVLGHFALAELLGRQGQRARAHKALQNVTQLLAGRPRADLIPDGDGLTVGRLLDLAALQKVEA